MKTSVNRRCLTLLSAFGIILATTPLKGQPIGRPDRVLCMQWAKALEQGGRRADEALRYGWLPGCGTAGVEALSAAISRASTSRDTAHFLLLARTAGSAPSRGITSALTDLAASPSATSESRVMALVALGAMLGHPQEYGGVSGTRLFVDKVPPPGKCRSGHGFPPVRAEVPDPMGEELHTTVAHGLERVLADRSAPEAIRNLASCIREAVDVPVGLDLSVLTFRYVCEVDFIVRNPVPLTLELEYSVDGTDERGEIEAAPDAETRFFTFEEGTVRIGYRGRVLAVVENDGIECP